MTFLKSKPFIILLICFGFLFSACSGGGSSEGGGDTNGRTNKTGIRIVHTSIDTVPIGLYQDGVYLTKTRYNEAKDYVPVAMLPSTLRLTRGVRPNDVVKELSFVPTADTEYTVLVLGQAQDNQVDIELVSEPIGRPSSGFGRVRFINALIGANSANCSITDGISTDTLASPYGVISAPIEIGAGVKTISVEPSSGEQKTQTLELPDRGEWLIVLAGKNELQFSVLSVISDLD